MTYGPQQPSQSTGEPRPIPPGPFAQPSPPSGHGQTSVAPAAWSGSSGWSTPSGAPGAYGGQQPPFSGQPFAYYQADSSGQSYGQYGAPGIPLGLGPTAPLPRPGTVTAGAVMTWIGGGLAAVLGAVLVILAVAGGLDDVYVPEFGADSGPIVLIMGVLLLVIGALVALFGTLAFRGKLWAAVVVAAFAGLAIVGSIIDAVTGTYTGLIGTTWTVTSAVLLLLAPSQAYYRSR